MAAKKSFHAGIASLLSLPSVAILIHIVITLLAETKTYGVTPHTTLVIFGLFLPPLVLITGTLACFYARRSDLFFQKWGVIALNMAGLTVAAAYALVLFLLFRMGSINLY